MFKTIQNTSTVHYYIADLYTFIIKKFNDAQMHISNIQEYIQIIILTTINYNM